VKTAVNGSQVQRIYLDELENPDQQPIGIGVMQLTLANKEQMIPQAQRLIERSQQENLGLLSRSEIIDVITPIWANDRVNSTSRPVTNPLIVKCLVRLSDHFPRTS
jgi:predicted transposase YdaD